MPLHDLSGIVCLIFRIGCIGPGWGKGTMIATLFARQGTLIFGFDISRPATVDAASQIRLEPPSHDMKVMHEDATSSASAKEVVNACMATHG
ncbi:hypothetical protein MMC21_001713 [Puttea exsequens]|nr:hypothetical protein [Puttea exsequens]